MPADPAGHERAKVPTYNLALVLDVTMAITDIPPPVL